MSKVSAEDLKFYAQKGDVDAENLLTELERFKDKVITQENNKIRGFIDDISHELAKPEANSGRDDALPLRIKRVADLWLDVICESFSSRETGVTPVLSADTIVEGGIAELGAN